MANITDSDRRKQEKTVKPNGKASHPDNVIEFGETRWRQDLARDSEHHPIACLSNAIRIFRWHPDWKGVLGFDQNSGIVTVRRALPWPDSRRLPFALTDSDAVAATDWLQNGSVGVDADSDNNEMLNPRKHIYLYTTKENVADALSHVARLHSFHPIKEYLESLEWDGYERLPYWLQAYFGAQCSTTEQYDYVQAVSRCFPIAAVARIFLPGCQMDTCLILEGYQGTFKSTGLKKLFHGPVSGSSNYISPWFTDQMPDIRTKDASIQLMGKWIAEFSDMGDPFKESNRDALKGFLSRGTDRYRPVRGKQATDVPRQCVFAGTTNKQFWNGDETGARRFWPIKTGWIDLRGIEQDRDQIWAEAMVNFHVLHKPWHFTATEERLARAEQEDRREVDVWESSIAEHLNRHKGTSTSVRDLLRICLQKETGSWNRFDEIRVARCLQVCGWEKYRETAPPRQWKYRLVEAE